MRSHIHPLKDVNELTQAIKLLSSPNFQRSLNFRVQRFSYQCSITGLGELKWGPVVYTTLLSELIEDVRHHCRGLGKLRQT